MPVIIAVGCYCRAFDQPLHVTRPDDKDAERFLRYFRQRITGLSQNPDADPRPLELECPRNTTLDLGVNSTK